MKGIVAGLLLAGLILSCAARKPPPEGWQHKMEKLQEIDRLYSEIRVFRSDMKMDLEPPVTLQNAFRDKSTKDAARVCPENHKVPATCDDTCRLSSHICENAEQICKIADELGLQDRAQEKCTSAKASCREAKQRCCNCSIKPPTQTAPVVEPVP